MGTESLAALLRAGRWGEGGRRNLEMETEEKGKQQERAEAGREEGGRKLSRRRKAAGESRRAPPLTRAEHPASQPQFPHPYAEGLD